jgi:type III secretion system YscI/HrpB-like protein
MNATAVSAVLRSTAVPEAQSAAPGGAFADILRKADAAQSGMDGLIARAVSGPEMKPGELLALQASLYRSSLELDLASKIVEKVSGGIKQTLGTNV